MTDNDYTAAFEEQTAAADAFDNAEGYFFQNEPLEPFSGRRSRIAKRLGLQFFDILGDPEKAKAFAENKTYEAFDDDMVLVLWLCSVPKERCARARRYIDRALEEADEWADQHGVYPGGHGQEEACEVFTGIMMDIVNSMARTNGTTEDDTEAPGKSPATTVSMSSHLPAPHVSQSTSPGGTSRLLEDTNTSPDTLRETA